MESYEERRVKYWADTFQPNSPPDLKRYIPAATREYLGKGLDPHDDKAEAQKKIFQIADGMKKFDPHSQGARGKAGPQEMDPPQFYDIEPIAIIKRDIVEEEIAPQIKVVRKELFGKESPPFSSLKKATAWIEQERLKKPQDIGKRMERARILWGEISTRARELSKLVPIVVSHRWNYLPWIPEKGWATFIPFRRGSPLDRLEATSRELSESYAGLVQFSVIAHILAGKSLLFRSCKTTLRKGTKPWDEGIKPRPGRRECFGMELYRRLSKREFGRLYDDHLKFFKGGKKELTDKHVEVWRFVKKRGGAPTKKGKTSWHQLQKEWNESRSDKEDRYGTKDGLRMAYKRINKAVSMADPEKSIDGIIDVPERKYLRKPGTGKRTSSP